MPDSADIKSVISLLCKELKVLFGSSIKPEHFRLAKFNKTSDNVVSRLWDVLFRICKEEVNLKISYEGNVVDFVKLNFALMNYNCLGFYTLPLDMSSGSRELLLALSWLLATKNIIDSSTRRKVIQSNINREFGDADAYEVNTEAFGSHFQGNLRSTCDHLLRLAQRLRYNLDIIHELDQQKVKILHKIHEATKHTCGLPHLSVGDIRLVREESAPIIQQLKCEAVVMEIYFQWSRKCQIFWNWMVSVTEEREKHACSPITTEEKGDLVAFLEVLRNIIKGLINERIDEGCDHRVNDSPNSHFYGVPRYFLVDEGGETEVAIWLQDSEEQVKELKQMHLSQLSLAETMLKKLGNKMKGVCILTH